MAQRGAGAFVQPGDVGAAGSDAEREGPPPVVHVREGDLDGEPTLGDVVQPGRREDLGQLARAGAWTPLVTRAISRAPVTGSGRKCTTSCASVTSKTSSSKGSASAEA